MSTDHTPSEQAADLAALQAAAAEPSAAAPLGPAPQAPAAPDLAAEIAGLVSVAVATLSPMFPSLRTTYTPEITQAAAQAIAAVCTKHGWAPNGLMGRWGEEIACVAIVGPLAWQTAQGIRADLEARKPREPAASIAGPDLSAPPPATQDVGSKTVTFAGP